MSMCCPFAHFFRYVKTVSLSFRFDASEVASSFFFPKSIPCHTCSRIEKWKLTTFFGKAFKFRLKVFFIVLVGFGLVFCLFICFFLQLCKFQKMELAPSERSRVPKLWDHKMQSSLHARAMNSNELSIILLLIVLLFNQHQEFLHLKFSLTFHINRSQQKFSIPIAVLLLEIIIHFSVWLWGRWLPYILHLLLPAEIWNVHVIQKAKIWRIVPHWSVRYDKVSCAWSLH